MKVTATSKEDTRIPGVDIDHLLWVNGKFLLSASTSNGIIKVWSKELQPVSEFAAHDYSIYHMTGDDNSTIFYTASADSKIRQWTIDDQGHCSLMKTLEGHTDAVTRVKFFEKQLYSADEKGEVKIWRDGLLVHSWNTEEEIWHLAVAENTIFAIRDRDVTIFSLSHRGDGKIGVSIKNSLPGSGPINLIGNNLCFIDRSGMEIEIHDAITSGNPLKGKLKGHNAIVNTIVGNATSTRLISSGWDKKVIAWDLDQLTADSDVEVEGYVNACIVNSEGTVFVGGENSFLTAITLE